jgi:hypothetical protein
MYLEVEDRYFTALNAVASARLGAEHPCTIAAMNAARVPSSRNLDQAQAELARLDGGIRQEIEAELDRWMREDV